MVLCALVFVICVLSVLYHRKREQKHQVAIQPSQEEQETRQGQSDCRATPDISNKVETISWDKKRKRSNNRLLLRLNQPVLESQIYQIYSTGIYQPREMSSRPKSAGPVLSRADGFGRCPGTEIEHAGVWMVKDQEIPAGWTEQEFEKLDGKKIQSRKKGSKYGNAEKERQAGKTEMEKCRQVERRDEFIKTLKAEGKYGQNLECGEKGEHTLERNVKDQGFLHIEDSVSSEEQVSDEYNSSSSLARSPLPPEHDYGFQSLGDVENIPYLTIGADPEKRSQNPEQICTKTSNGQLNLRPIRHTLSWPPTAIEWKKRMAQTQQVLNVSPKLIFVTECEYHRLFPSGISSAIPENIPQASCSGFPEQQLRLKDLEPIQSVELSMEICEFVNRSCIQDMSSLIREYVEMNEGQSEMIKSHCSINNEAHSDFVTIKPLCEGMHSEAATEVKTRSGKKKKSDPFPKGEQTRAISKRQPKRAERDGKRDKSRSNSGAHSSGGSPSDDNLLVDNEYSFIDLLHEVVENRGRWTRDRWRQSHMKKQKI